MEEMADRLCDEVGNTLSSEHHESHDESAHDKVQFWALGLKFLLATYPFFIMWAIWVTTEAVRNSEMRERIMSRSEIELMQDRNSHTMRDEITSLKITLASIQATQQQILEKIERLETEMKQ